MKREERTLLNQLRKSVTPDTINVEIPVSYTHEGRQAIHELLTIEKGLYAPCIYWNDILGEYCVHYERTMGDPTATATKRDQETLDIDEVTAELPRRDRTWTGYPKPTETTDELKGANTMMQTKQRAIKELVAHGHAIDITNHDGYMQEQLETLEGKLDCIAYSHGVYGVNGLLLKGQNTGSLYAITTRSSAIFLYL